MFNLQQIENAYLEAIEFTDCGPDDPEREAAAWSESMFIHARMAVAEFIHSLPKPLRDGVCLAVDQNTYSLSQFGHDLWLTRNGHGAGFWDRGLGELGDNLSDHARIMGEACTYVADSGELEIA